MSSINVLSETDQRIMAILGELAKRSDELREKMDDPEIAGNHIEFAKIAREYGQLQQRVENYRRYEKLAEQLEEAQSIVDDPDGDPELRELAHEELEPLRSQCQEVVEAAKEMLVMSEGSSVGSIIIEIRAGTGGDEAALFAGDLYGMYKRYAEKRRWKLEPMSFAPTELGGFREVIICFKGNGVWQELKYEGGGHRVQRVPETETQGRIHTSAATVAVLPEPEEVDIDIKPEDVLEHVSRASGPGGQSVNKLNSAIKLEHVPTGITVSMQDEKSQHKNRAKAWRILRSRIYEREAQKQQSQRSEQRKLMIGSGDRSQRIRTYNFPQNRVTDHRINLSLYSLDKVIMGDMDEIIKALIDHDKQQKLEELCQP